MKENTTEYQEFNWLNHFNELIIKHISNPNLTNAWLASQLNISESKFYRTVEKLTGQTPNHYIRNIRLTKAHQMLHSGQYLSVKEVVPLVGFTKGDYFTILFKRKYGQTPLEVLKKIGIK